MPKFRLLSIHLMSVVVFFAIGLAALRFPSPVWASSLFTVALVLPLIAILKSISCDGPARLPWIGLSLFGLVFLSVSFRLPPSILGVTGSMPPPDTIVAESLATMSCFINPDIYSYILSEYPSWPSSVSMPVEARASCYFSCCGSLVSLFFAMVGWIMGRMFSATRERIAAQGDGRGRE
jgi:hypothetical protein